MELISREEAKRKIIEELDSIDHVPSWVFRRLERVISSLPTIEEQKEGEWIDTDYINLRVDTYLASCSECGYQMNVRNNGRYFKYCPYCGAYMKGE